jgi:hypothetical protein
MGLNKLDNNTLAARNIFTSQVYASVYTLVSNKYSPFFLNDFFIFFSGLRVFWEKNLQNLYTMRINKQIEHYSSINLLYISTLVIAIGLEWVMSLSIYPVARMPHPTFYRSFRQNEDQIFLRIWTQGFELCIYKGSVYWAAL